MLINKLLEKHQAFIWCLIDSNIVLNKNYQNKPFKNNFPCSAKKIKQKNKNLAKKPTKALYIQSIYNTLMATDMISLKLERNFLKDIDNIVKIQNYQNRTEFIRNALREKIEQTQKQEAIKKIAQLKGASNKKTSQKELEKLRKKAFDEFEKEL